MRCPTCGQAELVVRTVREKFLGADLGEFEAEVCPACGESLFDEALMAEYERRAKAAGVWGLGRDLALEPDGDGLKVSIPPDLVRALRLRIGGKLHVHLEDDRIVVDTHE